MLALMPLEVSIIDGQPTKRPKYILLKSWTLNTYGKQNVCLIEQNLDPLLFAAFLDVYTFPNNLRNQVGIDLTRLTSYLESNNIPANHITANNNFNDVFNFIIRLFKFAQMCGTPIFDTQSTLDTNFNNISPQIREVFTNTRKRLQLTDARPTLYRDALINISNRI